MKRPKFVSNYMINLSNEQLANLYDEIIQWNEGNKMPESMEFSGLYFAYKADYGTKYAGTHLINDYLYEVALRFANSVNGDIDD